VESSGKNWRQKVCISYNLRLFYRFPGPLELQTGISMQNMGSKGYFEHPEPYVLNYILDVKDESLRVPLILNWNFRDLPGKSQLYLGFGAYMDWVYDANMQISREYVTGVEHSLRDPRDEMGEYIPGLQLQVGSRAGSGRIELVYWRDAQSFNLQERGSEKLRRSGIMLSYSLDFVSF
ncbi:MAG TPA: hypothetical protein PLX59_05380, partial [Candidatus Cloacimonadota bacterium]|nr:hypothetical protein [Candidatus Cloacimonadota bacterium]